MYMTDSGLFCHLIGVGSADELINSNHKGDVVETFVYSELLKHIGYSQTQAKIYHYRTNDKKEIDFVLQKGDKIFAIEVKSSRSIKKDAFKHITDFQNRSAKEIVGIVFYGGDDILPFGDAEHPRFALPLGLFFEFLLLLQNEFCVHHLYGKVVG